MKRSHALTLLVIYIGLAVAALLIVLSGYTLLSQRAEQITLDPLGSTRLYLWRDSFQLLRSLPAFGYGLESFPRVYPHFESQQTALHWPRASHESIHNYFLDTLFAKGFFGLVVVVGLSVSAFRSLIRLPHKVRPLGISCLGGHLAGLTACMFFTPQLPALVYLYVPICILNGLAHSDGMAISASTQVTRFAAPMLLQRAVRALCFGSLGLAFIMYGSRLFLWDHILYQAKLLFDSGQTAQAVQAFTMARQIAPPNVTAENWFSRELLNSSPTLPPDTAAMVRQSLEASIEYEEDFENSYLLLAAVLLRQQRCADAEHVLRQALADVPNWPAGKMLLAVTQCAGGRTETVR